MDLDKVLINLGKQGWKLEKGFLDENQNFLQDLVDETEKLLNTQKEIFCKGKNNITLDANKNAISKLSDWLEKSESDLVCKRDHRWGGINCINCGAKPMHKCRLKP